jgi:hypothetical protein
MLKGSNNQKSKRNLGQEYVYLGLSLLPFIVLCFLLIKNMPNFPYWDQWCLADILKKWHNGSLTLVDLWQQHNEHRIIFPYLVMLFTAVLTKWNLCYEIAINLFLGTCIYAILFFQIRKLGKLFNLKVNIALFLVSVLVFSFAQAENWIWGWQIAFFMNVFSVIAGIFFLASPVLNQKTFVWAIISGIVAAYSSANGIVFWIIGFVILSIRDIPGGHKKAALVSWGIVAAFVMASYLYGYHKPSHHPSCLFVFRHPMQALGYFFAYLGNPFFFRNVKFVLLPIGLGLFCFTSFIFILWLSYKIVNRSRMVLLAVLPWFSLAVYSIVSAVITMFGRSGFGIRQAISSRYVTTSNLLWISVIVLAPVLLHGMYISSAFFPMKIFRNRTFQILCLIVFLILEVSVGYGAYKWSHEYVKLLSMARSDLESGHYDDVFIKANVFPGDIHDKLLFFAQNGLLSFRYPGSFVDKSK